MSFFYLAHLGRGFEKEPKFVFGLKIAFCTISFTGYMLFIMYESYLSASIIVKNTGPPVKNIEEMAEFPHKLAMSDGGSIHKMFLNAKNDSTYGQLLASGKIDSSIILLTVFLETIIFRFSEKIPFSNMHVHNLLIYVI